MHGGWACVVGGDMHGRGACMAGGVCGRVACVAGGMHGEGCACLGVVHAWDRMTDACKILPCRKLRLRAVISKMF